MTLRDVRRVSTCPIRYDEEGDRSCNISHTSLLRHTKNYSAFITCTYHMDEYKLLHLMQSLSTEGHNQHLSDSDMTTENDTPPTNTPPALKSSSSSLRSSLHHFTALHFTLLLFCFVFPSQT